MVREEGLEPSRLAAQASKTCVSAIPPFPREWPLSQRLGERLWVAIHRVDDEVETVFLREVENMGILEGAGS
jgi:hypothetical protein